VAALMKLFRIPDTAKTDLTRHNEQAWQTQKSQGSPALSKCFIIKMLKILRIADIEWR